VTRTGLKILSVLGFLWMVAGGAGLYLTHGLFSKNPAVIAAQVTAVVLLLWARRTFGRRSFHLAADTTEGALVTAGPYSRIRHPVYSAYCLFLCSGALGHPSVRSVLFAGLAVAGAVLRVLCEEHFLRKTYPEYREYAARTSRMIPYIF